MSRKFRHVKSISDAEIERSEAAGRYLADLDAFQDRETPPHEPRETPDLETIVEIQ